MISGRDAFVDQQTVGFVDDDLEQARHQQRTSLCCPAISMPDHGLRGGPQIAQRNLIAEKIGDQFLAGDIDNVAAVMVEALVAAGFVNDMADAQAEHAINRPHLLGVAGDEIIVDGDDVHRLPVPAPNGSGERGGEGFAFAGGHLGDEALHMASAPMICTGNGRKPMARKPLRARSPWHGRGPPLEPAEPRQIARFRHRFGETAARPGREFPVRASRPARPGPSACRAPPLILGPADESAEELIQPLEFGRFDPAGVEYGPEIV